jgi:hypothetical protein
LPSSPPLDDALAPPTLAATGDPHRLYLRWARVPDALFYEAELRAPDGSRAAGRMVDAREEEASFSRHLLPLFAGESYQARVRALAEGSRGAWSRVQPVALAAEADAAGEAVEDFAALLPAPLLQAYYEAGSAVLRYTSVAGADAYEAQLLTAAGTVAAERAPPAGELTATFPAAEYGLQQGQTYQARVRGTAAGGVLGRWSISQPVTVQDLAAPAASPTFAGGTLFADVAAAVPGAQFYAFRATSVVDGREEVVDEAFAAPSGLPVAFAAPFADGVTCAVAAQAVAGSVLGAWSAPAPITVAVLAVPALRLGFAAPDVVAAWDPVGELTGYEFELWTTGGTPRRLDHRALTQPPYTVRVSQGIREDGVYLGRVRSQAGLNSSAWSQAEVRASVLDPLLQALRERLEAAWHAGSGAELPIDAATLGEPGAAVVGLMQGGFGAPELVVTGTVGLAADPVLDTVTVTGSSRDTVLGVDDAAVTVVFRASGAEIVADFDVYVGVGWDLGVSFPLLAQTVLARLSWDDSEAGSPAFVLSSLGAPASGDRGAVSPGLNLAGRLLLEGPAAPLLALVPAAPDPLPVTGAVHTDGGGLRFDLAGAVPAVTLAALPGLGPLAFGAPRFVVHAASNPNAVACALWVAADVGVGGVVLPLAVQLPQGGTGWAVLLLPGRGVPVADLGALLGFVTGTSVLQALPADVRHLTSLQLNQFRIALDPDFTGFRSLTLAVGSTSGTVGPLWSPLPGVLDLTTLSASLLVARDADGGLAASGRISGAVVLGGRLRLGADVALPLGTGDWVFTAGTGTPLADLGAFDALVGGSTSFAGVLPGGLGALRQFTVGSLRLVVDPTGPRLRRVSLNLFSNAEWHLVEDAVVLTSLATDLTLEDPTLATRQLTGTVSGAMRVGSVAVQAVVERAAAGSPWTLTVTTDRVRLPSLGDLARLVGGEGAAALLPATLAGASFSLWDIVLEVDLSERALRRFSFALATADTWILLAPDLLTAGEVSVFLALDWTSGARRTTGSIQGTLGLAGASLMIAATYAAEAWTIEADMAPPGPDGTGALSFSGALAQLGIGGSHLLPRDVGLPALTMTSGHLRFVPSTGELELSAGSALGWPVPFGTGARPLQVATLGGSVHRLPGGAGWSARVTGSLAYGGIGAVVGVALGGPGTDTVIEAAMGTLAAADVPQLADGLAATSPADGWSTLAFPPDFPGLGLTQAHLRLDLTRKTLLVYGTAAPFGTGVFVVQQAAGGGWEAALGLNLSSGGAPWSLGQLSQGLAPASAFFAIDQARAALAISTVDGQALAPIVGVVPELARALPGTVRRGANFFGELHFAGPVVGNVPRILGTDPGTTVTLLALIAARSDESLFEVRLDRYPLVGGVTFSDVLLRYRPGTSPALALHGTVTVPLDGRDHAFTGDLQVLAASASFRLATAQSAAAPLGMTGITLTGLALAIDYAFPEAQPATVSVVLSGGVAIGGVASLTGLVYLLDGIPVIAEVLAARLGVTDLFQQSVGVQWPESLVPLELLSASVYCYRPADPDDHSPLAFRGRTYFPGFNVAAHVVFLGRPATLTLAVAPGQGVTATGALDAPVDWGFVVFSGGAQRTGPSAALATYPQATLTLTAGFTLFDLYVGVVAFALSRDASSGEMVGTVSFTRDLPVFGTRTLVVSWSESGGFRFEGFPVELPAKFVIPEITSRSAGCLGKQILQALPVDTRYDFDTDFSISDGALVIGLQGYFALTTLKLEVLRIDLQRLTITVPVPTGGEEPFRWSDVPEWIARTLAENAYSLLVQVLADPASLAKLLAIEGVKYAVSALVDALVCEDPAKWGRGTAQSFVEGATSAFPTPVVVGGVPVVVGGIGVVVGPGGAVAVGSGPNPPAPPAPPVGLTMSYTGDMLHLGWGLVSGATSYAFRLTDSAGRVAAQRSNLGGTSASVPREQLTWGETYTFTVLPNNGGVLGGSATASYPVPTPRGTADGLASGGTRVESAGAALREVFPSLDAGVMAATLQGAYGATDPAAWATPTAAALRNAGFDREAAHGALSAVFPGITREQLAAAMQAAYSLDPAQLAEYLARLGFPFTETAAILASAFTPRQGPAAVAALLRASYSGLGAADLVAALAAARFAPAETARATAGEVPSTTAAEMAGYLAAAYTSPAITPEEVAAALVAAFPGTVALEVARALRGAFAQPPIGPAEVARALVAAFTQPAITAAEAAPALAAAFGYPASVDAAAIAAALVVGFAARPIAPAEAAAALLALAPAPEAPAVARALVAAFTTPALTPLQAAQALVAAFTAPAPITTARVAEALVAAFTAPVPIDPAGVAAALAAAFPAPPITAAALAEALARAFPAATEPQVAVALVAGLPGASEAEVAGALVSVFAGTTPGAVALALATAFPATTPAAVAAALRAVFTLPAIEPPAVAVALVAGFVSPAPVTPPQLVAALQSAFAEPAITPGGMAAALVAALARPEPVTPERVAELLAGSFVPAPAPAEVAVALVAAFAGPQPVAPARVAAALLAAYPAAPPGPTEVALALVAAFRQPAPITPPEVAATLRGAAFPAPATPAQTAVALAAAFPAIDPAGVVAALFAAFAEPRPTPDVIAGALVAAFPRAIDAATLARTLAAAYAEPPVTPEQVAAALVAAMVDPPVAASAVAGALQEAFPGPPPVSMGAAASALVGAWPAARPLTPADAAAALLAGWKPAPAAAELAVALVAAFARPVPITPEQVAAALVASVGAAATPDAVATALVAAFAAPEPITPEATVRALVATPFPAAVTPAVAARALAAAFTQPAPITPLAVGQALHAMFGAAAAPPVLAAALAGAFPQATPSAVAQALAALFTSPAPITPAETAAALALAFPGIAPAAALQALFDAYVSPALTPVQGAAALVAVFTQPAHVSMAEVARALVAVFTTPAPVTPRQVAAALVQAFAAPVSASAVAAALVAAFTRPRPITSGEVAAALRGAFTAPPIEAPGTATALVAAFTQPAPISPAEVVAALQQAFADPPLAAADAARSVAAAFTSPAPITAAEVAAALVARFPGLTPAGCVQALQAAFAALGFPPAQAAIALVAAFTSPAITAPEVAAALRQAYPELTASGAAGALVAAFTGPAITAPAVATALAAAFPAETPASVAVALVAALVAPPVSPEGVAAALQAAFAGVGLAEVAAALAAAFTTPAAITPTAVAAALVATFPPETAGIRGVAAAVDGAFPGIGARGVAVALAGAFAGATPAAVGRALHEALAADAPSVAVALTAAFPGLTAAALAQALAATFGGIDLPALALALRAAYPAMGAIEMAPVLGAALPSVTVAQLAAALVAAWGYTIADLGDLLIALEVGFPRPLDADVAAAAVTSALKLTEADTDTLASTIARQFSLGRPPVEVAAMGVALRAAGVRIIPAAKALSLVYPLGGWTAGAFARLLSVYTAPEWELAALGKARGEALAAVAAQIRAQLPGLSAAQMTLVLASAFFHTRTRSGAVEPVGRGMKAAAYSLVDAAAAMGAFYPEWRAGDYAILQKVYDEPAA